jgi:hypothetical protein
MKSPLTLLLLSVVILVILKFVISEFDKYQKAKLKSKAGITNIQGVAGNSLANEKMRIRASNRDKGLAGELGIAEELAQLANEYGLTVLHDLSMPNSKANIDHVVIARSAIFVVDAKNYAGVVRIRENKDGVQTLYVGKYSQNAIVSKLKKYADAISEFLKDEGIEVRVVPLLAFHNGTFRNDTNFHVNGVTINAAGLENELLRFASGKGKEIDISDVSARILKKFSFKTV